MGGKKHGEGVYGFVNADVFEGEFRDDRMDGAGVYTFRYGEEGGRWATTRVEPAASEGVGAWHAFERASKVVAHLGGQGGRAKGDARAWTQRTPQN